MTVQSRSPLISLLIPAITTAIWFIILCGIVYPLLTTAVANVIFPYQAQGSLIAVNGKVIGSELIGQNFTDPKYFHPRPSATTKTGTTDKAEPYNAAQSVASNYGPTNKKLIDGVKNAVTAYRKENGLGADTLVPVDAVTASASGLDPDISIANANLQAPRVAKARNIPVTEVQKLISKNTILRQLGILGEPRVNVLRLNLSLDNFK
ncbi:K(+)-transporting ATPase subunit C [Aetokthonos hydrillicola Thurmond2011]|jgi:K+-transporting ATPase ATPase C chain|uniref:Potassium-transporting ATPase KdpC subunit n=1 Tax=Aetokthonos hydrillicola Thurmond2011 TaxID=2712845 RepID=A0AAP5M8N1_9CYAN|nr:K(+)-transporting ATPase subunit C [Aetokthonos hydrillicola]MBO3457988.1 K(+)-transporting ATPase subunit C [Aetokthonos hydrillicola CCALA 1050]MBW4587178.1 K(+)-transporting ATPase subunit C [Aetokthonos hydrillicola CCALA 1050]MDR9899346.1 K(+)-transporting ATPase subunit C [Aetokthonos hydrillicola Thurmond2011]